MKMTKQHRYFTAKKGKLVPPALLAKLDDAAIDLIIDGMKLQQVNFPAIVRKTSMRYCPHPGVDKEGKCAISMILGSKKRFDLKKRRHELYSLSCVKGFKISRGKPVIQSKWFNRQLSSYLQIYDPKCSFKIGESKCLSGTEREVAVFAKRDFKKGEKIDFLSGVCVPLTNEEKVRLEKTGKDFSILESSRYQPAAMLLGPARFVNHDCRANCQLFRPTNTSAYIETIRKISKEDEITLFYDPHYFGESNEECLCLSCSTRTAEC